MDWFAKQILNWSLRHGRDGFPWQSDKTPYRVWVSEIMLQQTQAPTVIKHFNRFIERFPNVDQLARASEDEVLSAWLGLGYYRRALRLREAAVQVVKEFEGEIPMTVSDLCSLPGIGRSTAGAILSSAYDVSAPILDVNVRRVLARFHAVNGPQVTRIPDSKLWILAESHTPRIEPGNYTQAIMDFGAKQCVRSNPQCNICPLHERCEAHTTHTVHLFPGNRATKKMLNVTKRPIVILDSEGACLLKRLGERGTYARLWETPELPSDVDVKQILEKLELPLATSSIHTDDRIAPYTISNQRVTESVTVVKYDLHSSVIGTPKGTTWYKNDVQTPLGISVKTLRRIDLARNSGDES